MRWQAHPTKDDEDERDSGPSLAGTRDPSPSPCLRIAGTMLRQDFTFDLLPLDRPCVQPWLD